MKMICASYLPPSTGDVCELPHLNVSASAPPLAFTIVYLGDQRVRVCRDCSRLSLETILRRAGKINQIVERKVG